MKLPRIIIFVILFYSLPFANNELPIGFTPEEWENRHLIKEMRNRTNPPPLPIRNIAEFERMQGVVIRYPFGITTSLIREMAEDVTVYCLVSTSSQNSAYNSMNNANVNMDNVEFINGNTDSYWTRDYGPWWVVDGNNDVSVVDHTYNRPRPNDNQAPLKLSNHLNTPYFESGLITAGGNYMTGGLGIGASTDLIYDENDDLTNNQLHDLMEEYYGISTYHGIADPNNTYIDHIDCWGKFLSPNKVLIRSVQTSHAQYDEIEETADFFQNSMTSYGVPWEVFRVYTPSNQPYTNSTILNNKVLVPITNSSWDDEALAVYQEALPGYEILSFTGSWESTDALHCRTKGVPDLEMLQIFHNPIEDVFFPTGNYMVSVEIVDLSEEGVIDNETNLFWKNDVMVEFEMLPLTATGWNQHIYDGEIPISPIETNIQYYIVSADYSGRSERLPIAGYFKFYAVSGVSYPDGDVNMDNLVNIVDIVTVVNHVLGQVYLDGIGLSLADMNNDNVINILDIISIVNIILGN
jgi:agmatine deiminase